MIRTPDLLIRSCFQTRTALEFLSFLSAAYGVPAVLATWSVLILQYVGYAIPWPPSL